MLLWIRPGSSCRRASSSGLLFLSSMSFLADPAQPLTLTAGRSAGLKCNVHIHCRQAGRQAAGSMLAAFLFLLPFWFALSIRTCHLAANLRNRMLVGHRGASFGQFFSIYLTDLLQISNKNNSCASSFYFLLMTFCCSLHRPGSSWSASYHHSNGRASYSGH